MRVDALCDVTSGMAEDAAFCSLVGSGIIKQRRHRVPAVMRSMAIGTDVAHDSTPYRAVPPIVVRPSRRIADECVTGAFRSGLDERRDAMMYGDDTDAGGRFASGDADIALTQMDVSFLQLQHLTAAHPGIEQDKDRIDTGAVHGRP